MESPGNNLTEKEDRSAGKPAKGLCLFACWQKEEVVDKIMLEAGEIRRGGEQQPTNEGNKRV